MEPEYFVGGGTVGLFADCDCKSWRFVDCLCDL